MVNHGYSYVAIAIASYSHSLIKDALMQGYL